MLLRTVRCPKRYSSQFLSLSRIFFPTFSLSFPIVFLESKSLPVRTLVPSENSFTSGGRNLWQCSISFFRCLETAEASEGLTCDVCVHHIQICRHHPATTFTLLILCHCLPLSAAAVCHSDPLFWLNVKLMTEC